MRLARIEKLALHRPRTQSSVKRKPYDECSSSVSAVCDSGWSHRIRQAPVPAADQAGIDATVTAFADTVTAMDFNKFATLWTDDADFVNIVGMHWHGKAR